jgi:hypothetical protein
MKRWLADELRALDLGFESICRALLISAAISFAAWAPALLVLGFLPEAVLSHFGACLSAGVSAAVSDDCNSCDRWRRFTCACLVAAGLPGVGPIGVALVLGSIWSRGTSDAAAVGSAPIGTAERSVGSSFTAVERAARARAGVGRDFEPVRSTAAQLEMLMSLRNVSTRRAVRVLRGALSDPREEVRLLAHALIERREAGVRSAIGDAARELRETRDEMRRFPLLRRLAFLHWELVESELVPRELAFETLTRASDHARLALALHEDGELCVLLARVRLRRGDGTHARYWLNRAAQCGIAEDVLAPLLAESAFVLRELDQVPPLTRGADFRLFGGQSFARVSALWARFSRNSSRALPKT